MAGEDLLWVAGIHRQFPFPGMIAVAAEGAIEADLAAAAVDLEIHAALRGRFLQGGLGLEIIDTHVAGLFHVKG
jgi:hypothetical protein